MVVHFTTINNMIGLTTMYDALNSKRLAWFLVFIVLSSQAKIDFC